MLVRAELWGECELVRPREQEVSRGIDAHEGAVTAPWARHASSGEKNKDGSEQEAVGGAASRCAMPHW